MRIVLQHPELSATEGKGGRYMHRKRISTVMAWVLALTIITGQGSLTFAAEEISASQEEFSSGDLMDSATETLQETESEISENDIDLFTDETESETFSAGDASTSLQIGEQEISTSGTYTVTYNTIYNFKPAETGIYKFDFGENAFEIGGAENDPYSSINGSKSHVFKALAGNTYAIKVQQISEEEEDSEETLNTGITTSISVSKLPGISSVTINSEVPEICEIAKEGVAGNYNFLNNLDYTLTLDDGTTLDRDNSDDYGSLWFTYTDINGQKIDYDDIQLGGEYGYRFFCDVDSSVMSPVYKYKAVSFKQKAEENVAVYDQSSESLSVTLGSPYKDWTSFYNYSFVYNCQNDFEGKVENFAGKYKQIDICVDTGSGMYNSYATNADVTYQFERGKSYYIKVMADHELSGDELVFTFAGKSVATEATIEDITVKNPEDIPQFYTEYLSYLFENNNMLAHFLGKIVFNVRFSDGTIQEVTGFGNDYLEGYGRLWLKPIGVYQDDQYNITPGNYDFSVYFDEDRDKEYKIGNYAVNSIVDGNILKGQLGNNIFAEGNSRTKHFYLENESNSVKVYTFEFEGVDDNADEFDEGMLRLSGGNINYLYKWAEDSPVSVLIEPGEKSYFEYWGTGTGVRIAEQSLTINSIQLTTPQLIKDANKLFSLDSLRFTMKYTTGTDEEEADLCVDPYDNIYELKVDVRVEGCEGELKDYPSGKYKVYCKIPQISDAEYEAGELEILSYEDVFKPYYSVGTIAHFSDAKRYNDEKCIGFNISENGRYRIKTVPEENYSAVHLYDLDGYAYFPENSMELKSGLLMVSTYYDSDLVTDVTVIRIKSIDDLKELYNDCVTLDSVTYETASWNTLKDVMNKVNEYIKAGKFDDTGIENWWNQLNTAKENLQLLPKPNPNPYPYYPDPVPTVTPTPTATPIPTVTPTPFPTPTEEPKPVDEQKPEISTAKAAGNKVHAQLKGEIENAEGYDFVLCASKSDFKAGKYLDTRKNLTEPEVYFNYVSKGTYYVYCHAWNKVDGKKVFSKWSAPNKVKVAATTVSAPKITSVKIKGRTITIKLSRDKTAEGVDLILGKATSNDQYGKRPVNYGKQVKKNRKGTTITFTNVPKGTYYVGAHAFNHSATDKSKVFSEWSNIRKIVVE